MWYDNSPLPDSRHARALASDTLKEVNSYTSLYRRALVEEDAGFRHAANEERKRVQAARTRLSDLISKFPLDLQGRLLEVLETCDNTLRTHLPFSPPLDDDPEYLANFINRLAPRASSEIGIPTAVTDGAPVRLAHSVTGGPTTKMNPLPPSASVEADSMADDSKEIFFDARRVGETTREGLSSSVHSFSTATIKDKKSSTPRESRSARVSSQLGDDSREKPASEISASKSTKPVPLVFPSSIPLVLPSSSNPSPHPLPPPPPPPPPPPVPSLSAEPTADEKTESLQQRYSELEKEREGIFDVIKRLNRELKVCDDEKKKIEIAAKSISGDHEEKISHFSKEEDRDDSVIEWLNKNPLHLPPPPDTFAKKATRTPPPSRHSSPAVKPKIKMASASSPRPAAWSGGAAVHPHPQPHPQPHFQPYPHPQPHPQPQPLPQIQLVSTDVYSTSVGRELLSLTVANSARDFLVSNRPPLKERFTGDGDGIDYENTMNRFELITSQVGVTDLQRFMEIKYYFSGSAGMVCALYERNPDPIAGLKETIRHLKQNYGRRTLSAQRMLDDLLQGSQIQQTNSKDLQKFILSLETTYKRAVETNRHATFDSADTG